MEEKQLRPTEDELMEREEKCRKSLKTVGKAIAIRIFVTGLLLWILLQTGLTLWAVGLMALVLLMNLGGFLPLVQEWKKQRKVLKEILAQYE